MYYFIILERNQPSVYVKKWCFKINKSFSRLNSLYLLMYEVQMCSTNRNSLFSFSGEYVKIRKINWFFKYIPVQKVKLLYYLIMFIRMFSPLPSATSSSVLSRDLCLSERPQTSSGCLLVALLFGGAIKSCLPSYAVCMLLPQ